MTKLFRFINLLKSKNSLKNTTLKISPSTLSRKCSNQPKINEINEPEYEEITVPVPWGHISCVRWGPSDVRPLLAFHGWQDNAFTWKNLVKHLPSNVAVMAAEFPGHGKSSRYPPGMFYKSSDNMIVIRRLIEHFGWESIPLLGHSMGAIASFSYASLFPKEVDFLVLLDNLKPMTGPVKEPVDTLASAFKELLEIDTRNNGGGEPPSYDLDDMVEKLYVGALKSIDKDKCRIMLQRGVAESKINHGKYYFTRDSRLKRSTEVRFSLDTVKLMAERITCPLLHLKFAGWTYFEPKDHYFSIVDLLREKNKDFEMHIVPGTHHAHLNTPEVVAPYLCEFLKKHYK